MKYLKKAIRWLKRPQSLIMNKNIKFSSHDIGEWTYGNPRVISWDVGSKFKIGKFCSIAEGTIILLGGEHNYKRITTYPIDVFMLGMQKYLSATKGDVIIGNDVWIGRDVLILSGVNIGDGAVIGARSVVTKDIQPYSIVVGQPARHIKYRFEKEIIEKLQKIRWWDWPPEKIRNEIPILMSEKIDEFIKMNERNE